jgi:hypothetical protein
MSDTIQSVKDLPEVSFIDNDTLEAMKTRMVANFESEWKRITGQEITLSPSDPNRIMLWFALLVCDLHCRVCHLEHRGRRPSFTTCRGRSVSKTP